MKQQYIISCLAAGLGGLWFGTPAAVAEPNRVTFPENIDELTLYTTVRRGDVTEHMLTSQEALEAIRNGEPIPNGTHVVLVDYRDGQVHRYFVMEKGAGFGDEYDAELRTDDWQFQWFWGDRSINMDENTERCRSCHQSRAENEYMYTFRDAMNFER